MSDKSVIYQWPHIDRRGTVCREDGDGGGVRVSVHVCVFPGMNRRGRIGRCAQMGARGGMGYDGLDEWNLGSRDDVMRLIALGEISPTWDDLLVGPEKIGYRSLLDDLGLGGWEE